MSIFSDELSFEVLFKREVFLYGFIKRGLGSAIRKSQMLLVHTFMAREQQDCNSFPQTSHANSYLAIANQEDTQCFR